MNRRTVALALIVLAVAAVTVIYLINRGDEPRTVTVQRGSLDISIETVGTIMPAREQVLRAAAPGVIESVGAEPGDRVDASDIVLLLEQEPFQDQVRQAERAVEDAEFVVQITGQSESPDSDALQEEADAVEARRQLESARRALDDAEEAMQHAAIVASEPAIVLEILVAEGEPVTAGQPVARLYQPEALQLVAQVDELGLPSVSPGAPVTFRLDSFPERVIEGTVAGSAPEAEQQAGVASFAIRIDFDVPTDLDIRPGMNAEVRITTDSRHGVLLLPEGAIRAIGERAFVRVLEDGDEREVEIVLGRRGLGMVEIVEGLEEGDQVIVE